MFLYEANFDRKGYRPLLDCTDSDESHTLVRVTYHVRFKLVKKLFSYFIPLHNAGHILTIMLHLMTNPTTEIQCEIQKIVDLLKPMYSDSDAEFYTNKKDLRVCFTSTAQTKPPRSIKLGT
ncbi:hypothetical protein TNCV_3551141 [Trichonephila clavipes]|nr:hypothetical protein TNCV_3551141 [Trichonephila clavipes]